jgi:F0F1-type ATP synthase assembly protein I
MTFGADRVLAFGAIYGGPAVLIPAIVLALLAFWLTQRRGR